MLKFLAVLLKILIILVLVIGLAVVGALLFMPGIHPSSVKMALNVMTGSGAEIAQDELMSRVQLQPGYTAYIYARDLANPRFLHRTQSGRLLVSNPRSGEIVQLIDSSGDGIADQRQALLTDLVRPLGLEMYDGYLYVAESNQVGRIAYDDASGTVSGLYQPIITGLTDDGNHWSKSLAFDADGKLYVAMGSTCNVCEEKDERRATIMRFNADGSSGEVYASGLRNSVGLAFSPFDGALYATDNGRDLLGDDYPPCELNQIEAGGFYGWPYLNGNNEPDPDFGEMRIDLQEKATAPVFGFPAHNAPLGIHFPSNPQRRSALVALHGSWNRSTPDGYKVVELLWGADGSIRSRDFMWGFELDGDIVGRPVDITSDGEGGYFVSDDYARVIYRIVPGSNSSASSAARAPAVEEKPATGPQAIDHTLAAMGAAVYEEFPCGECHDASALTPVPLNRLGERYTLHSLSEYFLTPTPPMPLFELSAAQRQQLAHYLFSRQASPAGK
jgi:glucose/arabinose dehydrogenase